MINHPSFEAMVLGDERRVIINGVGIRALRLPESFQFNFDDGTLSMQGVPGGTREGLVQTFYSDGTYVNIIPQHGICKAGNMEPEPELRDYLQGMPPDPEL